MVVDYSYNKLKGRIVEKYGTRRAFADAAGISENWLSDKLNGKTVLKQTDIELWVNLLDINRNEINEYFFA